MASCSECDSVTGCLYKLCIIIEIEILICIPNSMSCMHVDLKITLRLHYDTINNYMLMQ